MPQLHLPMFPSGVTRITEDLAFWQKDGDVSYFNGHLPVFSHAEHDIATFRMITSQFCVNGRARQSDIIRAFGVTPISVKRSVKIYREKGPKGLQPTVGARVPQAVAERSSDRVPVDGLSEVRRGFGSGAVRSMVAGKLLPIHASKL